MAGPHFSSKLPTNPRSSCQEVRFNECPSDINLTTCQPLFCFQIRCFSSCDIFRFQISNIFHIRYLLFYINICVQVHSAFGRASNYMENALSRSHLGISPPLPLSESLCRFLPSHLRVPCPRSIRTRLPAFPPPCGNSISVTVKGDADVAAMAVGMPE